MVRNEEEGVGPIGGVWMVALGKTPNLSGGAVDLIRGVGAAQELWVLEGGACGGIDDGVSIVKEPFAVGDGDVGAGRRRESNNQRCGGVVKHCAGYDAVGKE